jgi:hypothetical protein
MKKYFGLNILEWVVLTVLLIIMAIYIRMLWSAPNLEKYVKKHQNSLNWISYNNLMQNAKNGDLLFMAGNSRGEKSVRWASGSIFSHCGLLFRENHPETGEDILYIWEADLGQRSKDGPRVMKVEDKIKYYHGFPYMMWRSLETKEIGGKKQSRPSTEDIGKCVKKYGDYDFDDRMYTWIFSNSDTLHNIFKNEDKIFCSELVAMTLQDLNILKRTEKPSWFSPGTFAEGLSDIEGNMKDGYFYSAKRFIDTKKYKEKKS